MCVETELSVSLPSTERPGQDIETRSRCEPLAPIVGVSARCSGSSVGRTPRPAQVGQAPCGLLKLKAHCLISHLPFQPFQTSSLAKERGEIQQDQTCLFPTLETTVSHVRCKNRGRCSLRQCAKLWDVKDFQKLPQSMRAKGSASFLRG